MKKIEIGKLRCRHEIKKEIFINFILMSVVLEIGLFWRRIIYLLTVTHDIDLQLHMNRCSTYNKECSLNNEK